MKRAFRKNIFRTIRKSFGRYVAILAIIALGVGFFTGLKASKPAMMKTGQDYIQSQKLYDYRLLSTWGFDQDEVSAIGELDHVTAAEGAVSEDFFYINDEGEERCLKAMSITQQVNLLKVTAGRMPEKPNECVLDAYYFPESMIGQEITIAAENSEDTRKSFAYDTYTVTGLVRSPMYLNMERGTTTIGNGKLSGFMFIPLDGFVYEYFEEVYVKGDTEALAFTGDYADVIDEHEDSVEEDGTEIIMARYRQKLADATAEIEDAKKELATKTEEAEQELKEAEEELARGEQKLADGKQELENTRNTLEEKELELTKGEEALAEGEKQLAAGKQALEMLKAQPGVNPAELAEREKQLAGSEQQLAASRAQLEEGRRQLADGKTQLAAAETELARSGQTLAEGRKDYQEGRSKLDSETAEAQQKITDAEEELEQVEAPALYVLDRSVNIGYASYESDVSIVEGVAKIFPIFFFLIAALVCSTTMTRMVDDERTQIGTLRALGYTEGAILFKYMLYSGSAAVIGAASGYFLGTRLFPTAIWTAYGMLYGFADIVIADDIGLFAISMLVALLCSAGTTFAACRIALSNVPAELIRPKAPAAGKRILLERIPFIWKRLKFLHKVSARNVFRFKKRMFMMLLGIAGCTSLVMAGFGVKDSISNIANNEFDHILQYDISASYTKPISEEAKQEIQEKFGAEIKNSTLLMEISVEAPQKNGAKTVDLMISENEDIIHCVDFHLENTTVALPGKGEILIDQRLASALNVGIGDAITLRSGDIESKALTVAGIFENYIYYYAYMTAETYEEAFGETYEAAAMYLALNEESDPYQVASYLSDMENASNISVVADTRARVENMMESMNYIVALVILSAAALAFIVLFNLGNINISERVREIATLKVLGFYPNETGSYVFRENMVLSIMGIILGLPLGVLLHRFIMEQIKIDMVSFEIQILPLSYLYSVAAVLGFTICVDLIMRRKIERINMAESLKSIE